MEQAHTFADNAGQNGALIVEQIKTQPFNMGQSLFNMVEFGIVILAKVTRSVLQNAASVAAMALTTERIVAEQGSQSPQLSFLG